MANSTQRAVSDGTMTYLDVSIGFQYQSDISVFYDDLPADAGTWSWSSTTSKRIVFTTAIANGVEVLIKRSTTQSKIINVFASGAKFNNSTMDTNFTQLLYLSQEAVEGAALTDIFNDVDFHGYKLKNLGTATDSTDAITYGQVQTMSNGAYTAQLAAQAAQAASEAARDLAQKWAAQLTTTVDGTSYSAKQYALNAATSATGAAVSASTATAQAGNSATSASQAEVSADAALASQNAASASENAAATSETSAATSAANAANSAELAAANAASAGGFRFSDRRRLTADTTLTATDNGSIIEVAAASQVTITMMPHAQLPSGTALQLVNLGTADVIIASGGDSNVFYNGTNATSITLPAKQWAILVGTGTDPVDVVAGAAVDGVYATAQAAMPKTGGTFVGPVSMGSQSLTVSNVIASRTTAPAAGEIGELQQVGPVGAAALASATFTSRASLTLGVGVWDVDGVMAITGTGGATVNNMVCGISTTSNAVDSLYYSQVWTSTSGAGSGGVIPAPRRRYVVASGTLVVYLVCYSAYTGGTGQTCDARMEARRVA